MNINDAKKFILEGNYRKVSESLSINDVFIINVHGNLQSIGYEYGYLYLPVGSGIKKHKHINDAEEYFLIQGKLSVLGKDEIINRCMIDEEHSIDVVSEDTLVRFTKVCKEKITNVNDVFSSARSMCNKPVK